MEFSQEFMTKFNIVKAQRDNKYEIREIYIFSDILEGETKEEYFERSGLTNNLEYLIFLFKNFAQVHGELKNIVPLNFGGDKEWLNKITTDEDGIFIKINCNERKDFLCIINTDLSKKEYFEKYPIDIDHMRFVLDCVIHSKCNSNFSYMYKDLVPSGYDKLLGNLKDVDKWTDNSSKYNGEGKKQRID